MNNASDILERKPTSTGLERVPFGTPAAEVARIVERDGGVVLTGLLTADEVQTINADLDAAGLKVLDSLVFGDDRGGEWGGKTLRLQHSLKYSKTLREAFLEQEMLGQYLAATLPGPEGAYAMFASHAIEIHPGETAQELHRDGAALMQTVGTLGPHGTNIMVNFLIALTEVTEEMGATRVIPGSQTWLDYSEPGSPDQTIAATMNPGDVLMISGKVIHGGGANRTEDRARRVISTAFGPGFLIGEEAWPHIITVEEARSYSERLQTYLGFRSVSWMGERPGLLWRVNGRPLEDHLGL